MDLSKNHSMKNNFVECFSYIFSSTSKNSCYLVFFKFSIWVSYEKWWNHRICEIQLSCVITNFISYGSTHKNTKFSNHKNLNKHKKVWHLHATGHIYKQGIKPDAFHIELGMQAFIHALSHLHTIASQNLLQHHCRVTLIELEILYLLFLKSITYQNVLSYH